MAARAQHALPHFAENFSADALLARLATCHHSLGSGEDVDAQSTQHTWNLIASHVHPAAGPGNALQVGDGGSAVRAVLQIDPQDLSAVFFRCLEVRDVTFFF